MCSSTGISTAYVVFQWNCLVVAWQLHVPGFNPSSALMQYDGKEDRTTGPDEDSPLCYMGLIKAPSFRQHL